MVKKPVALVIIVLGSLLLALAVAAAYAALPKAPGRIELSAAEFDFGTIPNSGPVSQIFEIRNAGQGQLDITGVSTSCGCTSASVSQQQLAPGEVASLTVTYDPLAHDGALGDFMRIVYVRSNDPETPEARLTIRVTVVQA